MSMETKWMLFFIWVVIAMTISTVGLVMIIRWYHREVKKVKTQKMKKQTKKNHNFYKNRCSCVNIRA